MRGSERNRMGSDRNEFRADRHRHPERFERASSISSTRSSPDGDLAITCHSGESKRSTSLKRWIRIDAEPWNLQFGIVRMQNSNKRVHLSSELTYKISLPEPVIMWETKTHTHTHTRSDKNKIDKWNSINVCSIATLCGSFFGFWFMRLEIIARMSWNLIIEMQ